MTSLGDLRLSLVEPAVLSKIAGMTTPRRHQRTHDPRLRAWVRETGDPGVVAGLGIPRSTVSGWLRSDPRPVVTLDVVHKTDSDLQREILTLRRRIGILQAPVRLLLAIVQLSGFRLDGERLPDGLHKARVLESVRSRAVERLEDEGDGGYRDKGRLWGHQGQGSGAPC